MKLLSIPDSPTVTGKRTVRRRDPDEMQMDRQTFNDLEIFDTEAAAAPSLFDLLNRTRTIGGGKALRTRMRKPWCTREKIRAVQQSLQHVLEHRPAYDHLPSEAMVSSVEQYLHCGLSLVTTRNPVELFLESVEIKLGDYKTYWQIMAGVERTARLLRALRRLTSRPELTTVPGQLGPWLEEARSLLDRPAFATLPREGAGKLPSWRVMRLDRVLRLDERAAIERLLRLVYDIDALISMADSVRLFNWVIPEVHDGPTEMMGQDVYHPFVPNAVPNPLRVDQQQRLFFLTGPNMAGKTTYLRACGTAAYLAHLGMGVPARTFRFSPCESLFTSISLADNVREGVSFFQAEALRMKTIAQAVAEGRRVIAFLDEPFMGTNVKDALDASRAVLTRLAHKKDSVFLVSSHLIELGDPLAATGRVDCCRFDASERAGRLEFDYILRPGISAQRLGVRVLHEQGVFDLLDRQQTATAKGEGKGEGEGEGEGPYSA